MTSRTQRPSRRATSGTGTRQKTLWFNSQSIPATVGIGSPSSFDMTPLAGIPGAVEGGFTVRRMILSLNIRPTTTGNNAFGAFGVLVIPRSASANLPDPIVDLVDWYLLKHWWVRGGEINEIFNFEFDIRTARKVRGEDRSLFHTLSNSASSSSSVEYSASSRLVLGYP